MGRGKKNYERKIKKLVKDLSLEEQVKFLGFVSEDKKFEMMQGAHILIAPSIKEGFGLTVSEAGIVGTPVVAYNSSGLRDIVKNGKNGILVAEKSPESLASTVIQLLSDDSLYQKLCQGAKKEARQYNWDNTASVMLDILKKP